MFGEDSRNAGLAEVVAKRRKRGKKSKDKDIVVHNDEEHVSESTPAEEGKELSDLEDKKTSAVEKSKTTKERRDSDVGPGPIE